MARPLTIGPAPWPWPNKKDVERAKVATAAPVCWGLTCPHCSTAVPAPGNGSEFWTMEDLRSPKLIRTGGGAAGKVATGTRCSCGQWGPHSTAPHRRRAGGVAKMDPICPYCRTALIGEDGKCTDVKCAARPGPTAGDVVKGLTMLKAEMESPAFAAAVGKKSAAVEPTPAQRTVLVHLRTVEHRPSTWIKAGFLFNGSAANACVRHGWAKRIQPPGSPVLYRPTPAGMAVLAEDQAGAAPLPREGEG